VRKACCLQAFGHNMNTTPSSVRRAGPSSLNCPKPIGRQGRLRPGSFPFAFLPSSRLRNLGEGYVGRRTGESACFFGDGLDLVGGKIQEPLKQGRIQRGIIYRTGEDEGRRKLRKGGTTTSCLSFMVTCRSLISRIPLEFY